MKKQLYTLLFSGIAVIGVSSCEDFLTQTNPNSIVVENYWEDLSDCHTGLNAVYNSFKNTNIYSFADEAYRSDMVIQGSKSRTAFDNVSFLQTFNDATPVVNNKWSALYTGIFRANQVFEGLERVEAKGLLQTSNDSISYNLIKGQAHFLRGLFYFYLHNSYNQGAVPIVDFVPKTVDEYFNSIDKSEDVLAFYRKDLAQALKLLPEDWLESKDEGRATSAAAAAVLGMSYLYDKEYDQAERIFKQIIDLPYFELVHVADNSTTRGELNKESILEVNYTLDLNSEFTGENNFYNTYGMLTSTKGGWGNMIPAYWLVQEFEQEKVDSLDRSNWIEVIADTIRYVDTDSANNALYQYGPDIIYDLYGETYERAYTKPAEKNVFYTENLVFRQPPNKHVYHNKLQLRTIKRDAQGNILPNGIMYKDFDAFSYHDKINIFQDPETNKYYRLRYFTPRASYSMVLNGDNDLKYYGEPISMGAAFNQEETAYFRKYCNWDIWKTEIQGLPANTSGINLRLIRLADIYLMYAESLIKGGVDASQLSEALTYVNRIRRRAGATLIGSEQAAGAEFAGQYTYEDTFVPLDSAGNEIAIDLIDTPEELMKHLMYKERPMELCLDGFANRVIDLRRWGITGDRFKELAETPFMIGTHTEVVFQDGKVIKKKSYNKQTLLPNRAMKTMYDYELPSLNYHEGKAYWPIPSVEKLSNPEIN